MRDRFRDVDWLPIGVIAAAVVILGLSSGLPGRFFASPPRPQTAVAPESEATLAGAKTRAAVLADQLAEARDRAAQVETLQTKLASEQDRAATLERDLAEARSHAAAAADVR